MQYPVTPASSASIGDTTWLLIGLLAILVAIVTLSLMPSLLSMWTAIGPYFAG